jgi:hypothetical protein
MTRDEHRSAIVLDHEVIGTLNAYVGALDSLASTPSCWGTSQCESANRTMTECE